MPLDPSTLYFMAFVVSLTLGLVAMASGWRNPAYRSVRDWGTATMTLSIGIFLVMLRPRIGDFFGVALANMLVVAGMALTYRSFLVYRRDSTRDPFGWVLVAITGVSVLLWQHGLLDTGSRSAVTTGCVALIMWRCAWLLGFRPLPEARTSQLFAAGLYAVYASLHSLRTARAWGSASADVLSPQPIEIAMIIGDTLLWTSVALCVFWMVVERQQAELSRLATRDPLTAALNRNALLTEYEREHYRCGRSQGKFAVALFDIDHFKRFNDTYGHLTGDEVLRQLVATLKEVVRQNDSVGRYGGEEFVVIMPDTDEQAALEVAERARAAVEARGFMAGARRVPLTVSAGVAGYPRDGRDWDALLAAADTALYAAKGAGRNRVMAALPGASSGDGEAASAAA